MDLVDGLQRKFVRALLAVREKPQRRLHHCTSPEGFVGNSTAVTATTHLFLERHGYLQVEVRLSEIPFAG